MPPATKSIPPKRAPREMLVTIGATASFQVLLDAVLQPAFLQTAQECGFTRCNVQCGPDLEHFQSKLAKLSPADKGSLAIDCFAFNPKGLIDEMSVCKENSRQGKEGLVISHAGAGTILDAMRMELDIIVVSNTTLLGNHQEDLAIVLEDLNYAVVGDLDDLPKALLKVNEKGTRKADWGTAEYANSAMSIVDEEAGFVGI